MSSNKTEQSEVDPQQLVVGLNRAVSETCLTNSIREVYLPGIDNGAAANLFDKLVGAEAIRIDTNANESSLNEHYLPFEDDDDLKKWIEEKTGNKDLWIPGEDSGALRNFLNTAMYTNHVTRLN